MSILQERQYSDDLWEVLGVCCERDPAIRRRALENATSEVPTPVQGINLIPREQRFWLLVTAQKMLLAHRRQDNLPNATDPLVQLVVRIANTVTPHLTRTEERTETAVIEVD